MKRVSREEARAADIYAAKTLGIPAACLMENAGAGAAQIAAEMLVEAGVEPHRAFVVVVAGEGGNGGDAWVLARHLFVAEISVEVIQFSASGAPRIVPMTRMQGAVCARLGISTREFVDAQHAAEARASLDRASIVVDGVFGSGLSRPPVGGAALLIDAINEARKPVLALDLPSGLDCDTGAPLSRSCVRAHTTATFGAEKLGFGAVASREFTGRVVVVPIGAPMALPNEADRAWPS